MNLEGIDCIVFDFGGTLSSDPYFKTLGPEGLGVANKLFTGQRDPDIVSDWMVGKLSSEDVAAHMSKILTVEPSEILAALRDGCVDLEFNQAVWDFAVEQHDLGRKTTLVTGNFDVFTDVIVPAHNLGGLFDAIVNSSDYGTYNKRLLWPIAFELLGGDFGYGNSLLIEDTIEQVQIFRANGGQAHQYVGDEDFCKWLTSD